MVLGFELRGLSRQAYLSHTSALFASINFQIVSHVYAQASLNQDLLFKLLV
jgi:hypothetical protein